MIVVLQLYVLATLVTVLVGIRIDRMRGRR